VIHCKIVTICSTKLIVIYSSCEFPNVFMVGCLPSVLRRCWLGDRKGIRPVKTEWWGTGMYWRGYLLERGANDLHMVQLMPLHLVICCSCKIPNGLIFWCWLIQVVLEKRPLNGCSSSSSSLWLVAKRCNLLPSVLWHCWLGDSKGIRPVKNMGGW